ncbi:TetR family transcriptional regulator, partial [Streptomyces sp. SID6013]|nr:TetR family transcriptional regulator [Streptomyces sp. SID6013]
MGYRCLMAVDREQVLRSAAALLTRKSTATMDEVARAAGISRATLHRHFAGRDALVRALESLGIAECEAALEAARTDEGPAADAVRRLVRAMEPSTALLAF